MMAMRKIVTVLFLALGAAAFAQTPATPPAAGAASPTQDAASPTQDAAPTTQDPAQQTYTLQAGAKIVLVPATVSIKGQIVYGLKADKFRILDNGVPQPVTLDEDAEGFGLSLVVAVQCSRMAMMEYEKLQGLPTLVESLVGGGPHEVALIRYGAHPELVQPFTRSMAKVASAMAQMGPCEDDEAATRDAVSYASSILENRDTHNRHAVLLVGEARDHGSSVKEKDLIAQLGRSNTVVDAVAYSPGTNETMSDLKHFSGGRGPIGSLIMAVQGMRKNTAKAIAEESGGDYFHFNNRAGFDDSLGKLTNRVHNYYLLSFPIPRGAESGLHEIRVTVPEYPEADIRARRNYYAGDAPPPDVK
ncbi:VWA domain-containing protein [Terriglobus roseus]|uniref:VWA domain-containing protein n=1 Tax=Terriglobus roseus TaxID=392734 RepID=UPI0002E7A443|nr:VWA domain-containing protein [Terriglobus roseus]